MCQILRSTSTECHIFKKCIFFTIGFPIVILIGSCFLSFHQNWIGYQCSASHSSELTATFWMILGAFKRGDQRLSNAPKIIEKVVATAKWQHQTSRLQKNAFFKNMTISYWFCQWISESDTLLHGFVLMALLWRRAPGHSILGWGLRFQNRNCTRTGASAFWSTIWEAQTRRV